MNAFTVYLKVVPFRGKRLEMVRDLQRLAYNAFNAISGLAGYQFAQPGGGQQRILGPITSLTDAMGYTPQFGNQPAMLMSTGFVNFDTGGTTALTWSPATPVVGQAAADTQVFCCNEVMTGQLGEQPWDSISNGAVNPELLYEAGIIRNDLEAALANANVVDSTGNPLKVWRLDYAGIVWGDKGHSLPPH